MADFPQILRMTAPRAGGRRSYDFLLDISEAETRAFREVFPELLRPIAGAAGAAARAVPLLRIGAPVAAGVVVAAAAAAAPVAVALIGSYLGAQLVTGAFETFAVVQEANQAQRQAERLEAERKRVLERIGFERARSADAAAREERNRAFQLELRTRGEAFTTEQATARTAEIAARDERIGADRALEALARDTRAIQAQDRQFEFNRQQQERAFAEHQQRDEERRADIAARDATTAAQRAQDQANQTAQRAAVEQLRSAQWQAELALDIARFQAEQDRAETELALREAAFIAQQQTPLPLFAEPLLPTGTLLSRVRNSGQACLRWQDVVANGWAASISQIAGGLIIIHTNDGRRLTQRPTCGAGFLRVGWGDLIRQGLAQPTRTFADELAFWQSG